MNRNNKIFQIIFSILILGIAFLLLLCIGIYSPKTVVRPAVVDEEEHLVPPPGMAMPAKLEQPTPIYALPDTFTPVAMISGASYAETSIRRQNCGCMFFICDLYVGTPVELRYDTCVLCLEHPKYRTYYMCFPLHCSNATEQVKEAEWCVESVEMSDAMHFDFSQIQLTGPARLSDYTLPSVKTPVTPRPPDAYNEQLQSYIYYSRANEREIDAFQLLASLGLFILNILTVTCSVVYIIESPSRR